MNTRIRFFFDETVFDPASFEILNPPVLPQEGKIIQVDWKYYIKDKKALKVIENRIQDHCFVAAILSIHYKPDEVEMLVILHKDIDYEDYKVQSAIDLRDRVHRRKSR